MAGANVAGVSALDVAPTQVLIDFFDDEEGYYWHHRLLLVAGTAGRWITSSPDFELGVTDLATHRVVVLERGAPVELAFAAQAYMFDPITEEQLAGLQRRAQALARVSGFATATSAPEATWLVADPASTAFGEPVPGAAIGDGASFVARERSALVRIDQKWVAAELVDDGDKERWRLAKASGQGRDPRLLGREVDSRGQRFMAEHRAFELFKNADQEHYPFRGPRVTLELLESIRSAGRSLATHHLEWVRQSGVLATGAVAREHFSITEYLRVAIQYDQVDVTMLASCEAQSRRLVQIEAAVRRSPKLPDFSGLEVMTQAAADPTGAAVTQGFNAWVASQQKDAATIAKQGRLLREEIDQLSKKQNPHGQPTKSGKKGEKSKESAEAAS